MSEQIITKTCRICKETKSISCFYKAQTHDGFRGECKSCNLKQNQKYANSPKGRKAHRKASQKYNESEKGKAYKKDFYERNKVRTLLRAKIRYQNPEVKAAQKAYFQSEKGKQVKNRYLQSEKGKIANRKYVKERQLKYPEQAKAQNVVNNAIRSGKLPRADTLQCHYCSEKAKDYHHHKGYAPEHRLDVVPICKKCHNNIKIRA